MNLAQLIAIGGERYPDAEAIVDGPNRWKYGDWVGRIGRIAASLLGLGIGKGDHVVLSLKNREQHAAAYWACQLIGAIATPINWRYAAAEVGYVVADSDAVAVVFEEGSRAAILEARPKLAGVGHWIFVGEAPPEDCLAFEPLAAGDGARLADAGLSAGDISIMLYTSGTTGRPKGVPRSHGAEYSAAIAHAIQSRNGWGDRTLGVMPLYHTMGVRSMITMAMLSGCLVCLPDWEPTRALELLAGERINSLYLVPTLYHDVVSLPDIARFNLSGVTKLGYAGAPMSGRLTGQVKEIFQPEVFVNHLGSTEVYTHTVCDRALEKPTCSGRPGVFGRIRVVVADPERQGSPDDLVPAGNKGELIVSLESAEAFAGYWRRPDADEQAIRGGWYFTGDLVYEDREGDIFTVGRVDDMIISGGENIYPLEVEEVLVRHPEISEVCVVGLPDDRLGQQVTAFLVPAKRPDGSFAPVSAEQMDLFCRAARELASFKRPRSYRFVAQLPKSPTGKLLRRMLLKGDFQTIAAG